MSGGYRCVNFNSLCRLCSSAGNNTTQIFTDSELQKKITECLPIVLNDKDKLPKVICHSCLEYVNVFSDFRLACSKAQKMLESCLNTTKLRNGGQVYIKDEPALKKVLKPIQNSSPPKILPSLSNIVMTTPTKPAVKKTILTSPNQPDFLSTIMQAVGIQTTDDQGEQNPVTFTQNIQQQPQYTFTLDSGTIKSGQLQYKIESAPQPQTQIITKDPQNTQTISVDEFIKMKKSAEEPKNKKPKFNLILQASPQKQVQQKPAQPQKSQIQIHNIEKISPAKQLVLPIIGASQPPAQSNPPTQPFAYVQMKIQPNADGQLTLTPATSVQPMVLSQQMNFQTPTVQPQQQQQQQPQVTVSQVPAQEQTDSQTQTPAISKEEDDDDNFGGDDYYYSEGEELLEETQTPVTTKKSSKSPKPGRKIKAESSADELVDNPDHSDAAQKQLNQITSYNSKRTDGEAAEKPSEINLTVCDVCKKVFKRKEFLMQHLKSHIGLRPFKCDEPTCNKSFSRKEHLLRHIVSHTGKKMFTCDVCQKLFSRKDNLNKHRRIHPETGQASIRHYCSHCNKGFAHRSQLVKHQLICDGKIRNTKDVIIIKKDKEPEASKKPKLKSDKKPPEVPSKPPPLVQTQPAPAQQPAQFVTFVHPQIQQQPQPQLQNKVKQESTGGQQIILSMSQAQAIVQAQQQKNAVYTFPTNLILNANGAFMTNTGEVVGNFKFDNQ